MQKTFLLVIFSLALAACGQSATTTPEVVATPIVLTGLDPRTIDIEAQKDFLKLGESTITQTGDDYYAIFFEEISDDEYFPKADMTFAWSKYDPASESWSVWGVVTLEDVFQNYSLPSGAYTGFNMELQPGELQITGTQGDCSFAILGTCLEYSQDIWVNVP